MDRFIKTFGHGLAVIAGIVVVAVDPALHAVIASNPLAGLIAGVVAGAMSGYIAAHQNSKNQGGK